MVQLQAKRVNGLGDRAMDKQKGKSFWTRHPIFTGLLIFFVAPLPFVPFVDSTSVDKGPGQEVGAERNDRDPTAAERRELAKRAFEQRALSHVASVIEQDRLGRIKRSILVELDQEVSMAELEVIGRMLQEQEPGFERAKNGTEIMAVGANLLPELILLAGYQHAGAHVGMAVEIFCG